LAYESLLRNDLLQMSRRQLRPSAAGIEWFRRVGIDTDAVSRQRRIFCRPCMDWSERRYHLAGSLGAAMLSRVCEFGWAKRDKASRVIRFTPIGERLFRELVGAPGARASLT
jgi:hypothetical protein